jgi:DUF4097 and DUF4098 domain-containing protein YvlB
MPREVTETLYTPEGCDLVVENPVEGNVEVRGWDKPQTQVTAVKHSDDVEIEVRQDGRRVIARTRHGDGPSNEPGPLGEKKAVDYTVHVPHSSNVEVKCVTGPVRIAEVQGVVRVANADGSIELDHVSGHVKLSQVS